jgi:hypothetical protein
MNLKYPQITQITQISAKGIGRAAERKTSHKDIKPYPTGQWRYTPCSPWFAKAAGLLSLQRDHTAKPKSV